MGYELDRLMERIGVSSPTLAYSGTSKPIAPTAPGAGSTAEQATAYNDLVTKYNADIPKYDADQAIYAPYKAEYQQRMRDFKMYDAPQYNTAGPGAADLTALNPVPAAPAPAAPPPGADMGPITTMPIGVSPTVTAPAAGASPSVTAPPAGLTPVVTAPPTVTAPAASTDEEQSKYKPVKVQTTVYGPDGKSYPDPSIAEAMGVSNYTFTPPAPVAPKTPVYSSQLAPPKYGAQQTVEGLYRTYLDREPDAGGLEFWKNKFGPELSPEEIELFRGSAAVEKPYVSPGGLTPLSHMAVPGYAEGGRVETHFQEGGLNDMVDTYDLGQPSERDIVLAAEIPERNDSVATSAQSAPPELLAQVGGRAAPAGLLEMLGRYQGEGAYAGELKTARETASRENQAFNKMLQDAIGQQSDNAPSKAEMYFRLAAAFGAPTRTGGFAESLSNVGKTLGEHAKETREAQKAGRAGKLALGLEAQKAKMAGAKEDLATLRALAGEEMKDKRAIASELLKDYVKSGQPQSAAGKQALDEGLVPGTPAFQARVAKIAELNIEKQMAGINASLAGIGAQQAQIGLAQQKFGFQQEQAKKLSPAELKLKTEAEDTMGSLDQAAAALKQAYALNPNTFDSSVPDTVQRKILEAAGSKDVKLKNTRLQENLLGEKALAGLKAAVGGNPTEGERKVLMDLQGIGAKSIEERKAILLNAFKQLEATRTREKKRLAEINKGAYRDTTPGAFE